MGDSLRLLLVCVEDEAPIRAALERAGIDAELETAMGAGLMRAALRQHAFDTVIAGMTGAPGFTPAAALAVASEGGPELPVIALVARDQQDAGLEAVAAGAADYVLTDELVRLPLAVRREVQTRRRREELHATTERLLASEHLFRRMAENAKDFIYRFRLKPTPCFEYVSPSVMHITGYSAEEHYRNPDLHRKLVHPEDLPFLLQALQSPVSQSGALLLRWVRRDGSISWTEQSISRFHDPDGGLVAIEGIVRDVTRRMRVEHALQRKTQELEQTMERLYKVQEQLVQSSKLAALGQFAAGMAHDFNNLLTPILGFSDLTARHLPADHRVAPYVREIGTTCRRAAALIRQLLTFAGQQTLQPKTLELNERVTSIAAILRSLVGEDVTVLTATSTDDALVKIDPCQLEQLLINLAANARDAMPDGGLLTIETAAVTLDEEFCRGRGELAPGDYVRLSVRDTGRGIDPSIKNRIFEPFFSTKHVSRGAGLGLSICHGVVHQSGGYIQVESVVGQGTTFQVYLPRRQHASEPAQSVVEPAELPRGHERVLLVEDEPLVRSLAADLLRTQGYEVTVAEDGVDALRVAGIPERAFDLVLTDVVMPRMGGRALAEEVQARAPDTRVLYISGYPDGLIEGQGIDHDSASILRKPFSLAGLAQKVREVLDRPREAEARQANGR